MVGSGKVVRILMLWAFCMALAVPQMVLGQEESAHVHGLTGRSRVARSSSTATVLVVTVQEATATELRRSGSNLSHIPAKAAQSLRTRRGILGLPYLSAGQLPPTRCRPTKIFLTR